MFVQLVGLPGAGKSTIAARLEELYPERFVRVTVEDKTLRALFASRPVATLNTLVALAPFIAYALLAPHSPLSFRKRFFPVSGLLNLLLTFRRLQRETTHSEKIRLFDEFVYQRAFSLFGYSTRPPSPIILRAFLRILRSDFLLPIFIATDTQVAKRRAAARPDNLPERMAGLNRETVDKIYACQATLFRELQALSPRALRIDNQGDARQCAERIHAQFDGRLDRFDSKPVVSHFVFNLSDYSGAAQQALALCRHLEDFDAVIFSCDRQRTTAEVDLLDDSIRVIHLSRNLVTSTVCIAYYAWLYRFRVFHLHGPVVSGLLAGLFLRRRLILKTTLLGWDDLGSLAQSFKGRILLWLVKRVDANIALSSTIAEINRQRLPAAKVLVLPNGVSTATPARPKQDPLFSAVGLVCRRKRTHLIIGHFLDHYAKLTDARLYIIGPYGRVPYLDESSEEYYQYCLSLIPPEHRAQVEFTGSLARSKVEEYYQVSLALLHFSESEGMPNALLEAMAANCVPITSELGGVAREIIAGRDSGFVLRDGERFPSIEELRACSRSRGPRRRIETHYTFDALTERYSRLYTSLLPHAPSLRR